MDDFGYAEARQMIDAAHRRTVPWAVSASLRA